MDAFRLAIAEYGYEPRRVLAEFEDLQYIAHKRQALEIATDEMEKNLAKLEQHDHSLRQAINLHSENLSVYNELANIGFGSKELRMLLHTILDITLVAVNVDIVDFGLPSYDLLC